MKRLLVPATAAALLLTGCATGETGHLDPEISPDLGGTYSQPNAVVSEQTDVSEDLGEEDETEGEEDETSAPGTSGAPSNAVAAAFAQVAGAESWYGDVTGVDVNDDTVLVSTDLLVGDTAAVEVCEAAVDAAEAAGVERARVLVRDVEGATLSEIDPATGAGGCSD